MFRKILIANRGEISRRIIRTAKKLNIKTCAIYAEADASAPFVREADEAVLLKGESALAGYLDAKQIIQIAKSVSVDAIHPGYGFLSENADFAKHVKNADITFIGPQPKVIQLMGDKVQAKEFADSCGVPVIPGGAKSAKSVLEAKKQATKIGYPILLKAAAGGGGKGMRLVEKEGDLENAFERARSEAKKSFADDRLLVEKYIEGPHHVEVQVLADKQGNVLHLGERECSIQRRHQKIIEESPSPFITQATRDKLTDAAVALAKAAEYESAGTVEFIVDKSQNIYFLEMNTRLQVEHPITEMVTGVDMVEQMICVAAGKPLAFQQKDIKFQGHSIEARVYAEDPEREFYPAMGRLFRYQEPVASEMTRLDSGVEEGDEIGPMFDPLISKVITHGENRVDAINHMKQVLDCYHINGVTTTIPFLRRVLDVPAFVAGKYDTNFIQEHFPKEPDTLNKKLAELYALMALKVYQSTYHVPSTSDLCAVVSNHCFDLPIQEGPSTIDLNNPVATLELDGKSYTFQFVRNDLSISILHQGVQKDVKFYPAHTSRYFSILPEQNNQDESPLLLSPMPGRVVNLFVKEGENIKPGQALAVIEAMKMENVLRAERGGVIKKVFVSLDESLASGQQLFELQDQ